MEKTHRCANEARFLPLLPQQQGRNEIRWRPGQEASLVPHVRTWGLSEANTLYWRRYMWHYWDFSAPFAVIRRLLVIRRLHSASVPGEKGPLAPTRYAPDIVHQISQKTMANKTDFSDAKPPVSKTICNFCNADSCPEEGIKSLNIFLTSGWY